MKKILLILAVAFCLSACDGATKEQQEKIIGTWVTDLKSPRTGEYTGKMYTEFTKDGQFLMTTSDDKDKVVSTMTYRLTKDKIYYKGRSTGNEELDSNYVFQGDRLILKVNNETAEYTKVQ